MIASIYPSVGPPNCQIIQVLRENCRRPRRPNDKREMGVDGQELFQTGLSVTLSPRGLVVPSLVRKERQKERNKSELRSGSRERGHSISSATTSLTTPVGPKSHKGRNLNLERARQRNQPERTQSGVDLQRLLKGDVCRLLLATQQTQPTLKRLGNTSTKIAAAKPEFQANAKKKRKKLSSWHKVFFLSFLSVVPVQINGSDPSPSCLGH